jgi:hypothetical protein
MNKLQQDDLIKKFLNDTNIETVKIFNQTFFPNPEYISPQQLYDIYSSSNDLINSLDKVFPKIKELVIEDTLSLFKKPLDIYEKLGIIQPKLFDTFSNGKDYDKSNSLHRRLVLEATDRGEEPITKRKKYPKEHFLVILILYYISEQLVKEKEITTGLVKGSDTPKYFVKDRLIRSHNKKVYSEDNEDVFLLPNKFRAGELAVDWLGTIIGRFMQIKLFVEAKNRGLSEEAINTIQIFFEEVFPEEEKKIIKTNDGIFLADVKTDRIYKQFQPIKKK